MSSQKRQYIIKTKGIYCSRAVDHNACFLTIRDGLIHAISDAVPEPADCEIIDLGNLAVSPLFCDYHLHFSARNKAIAGSIGSTLLRFGIGRAYEGGDKGLAGLAVREAFKGRPEIATSGYALYKSGGYGRAIGRGVAGISEAAAAIKELHSLKVDYIKIINSGYFEPETGQISQGGFDAAGLKQMVDFAKERGLEVYCHANGQKAVREAVAAGVSAVVHGLYADDESLAEMSDRKIALIPTVSAFQGLIALAKTGAALQHIEKAVEIHLSVMNKAFKYRVRLLPGSDSGPHFIPYGSAYIDELRLFLRAGIPFENVIQSASSYVIKEGAPADFILLDGLTAEYLVLSGKLLRSTGPDYAEINNEIC